MQVIEDLIGGEFAITRDGSTDVRQFMVTEIPGPDAGVRATAATATNVPRYGDPHPTVPGIQVLNVGVTVADNSSRICIVRCEYGVPSEAEDATSERGSGETTLTAIVNPETTNVDINGDAMLVRYSGYPKRESFIFGRTSGATIIEASIERPLVRATIRKRYNRQPLAEATTYVGTANVRDWSGFPSQTWLCVGIRSDRDGASFMVSHDFVYSPDTWRLRGIVDLGEGVVPIDAREGNGIKFFDVYPLRDFNRLGVRL